MNKQRLYAVALYALMAVLVLSVLPFNGSAVEGDSTYTVQVWVHDTAGVGLNNATVILKEGTDKMGGKTIATGTTSTYHAVVDNETLGTGDGSTKEYTVSGTPVKDWNGDDTVDENDIFVYVGGTKQATSAYGLTVTTGKVLFTTAPTDGSKVTATYTYNAGNGHVTFQNVKADNYVIETKLTGYLTDYKSVSVAGDSVYQVELSKYGEVGHALIKGNPLVLIGAGATAIAALGAVAMKMK